MRMAPTAATVTSASMPMSRAISARTAPRAMRQPATTAAASIRPLATACAPARPDAIHEAMMSAPEMIGTAHRPVRNPLKRVIVPSFRFRSPSAAAERAGHQAISRFVSDGTGERRSGE